MPPKSRLESAATGDLLELRHGSEQEGGKSGRLETRCVARAVDPDDSHVHGITLHRQAVMMFSYRPHPWHGIDPGPEAPRAVRVFVEITPFDPMKYEIDRETGFLQIDRPQRTSALPPAPYGFIPRTLAGRRVGALMEGASGGDLDPLDIIVLSERPVSRPEVLLTARVVGGIPMLDDGRADDKIVAILKDDPAWGDVETIEDLPPGLIGRFRHYFATYKVLPGEPARTLLGATYGRDIALAVVQAAFDDYREAFGADADRRTRA